MLLFIRAVKSQSSGRRNTRRRLASLTAGAAIIRWCRRLLRARRCTTDLVDPLPPAADARHRAARRGNYSTYSRTTDGGCCAGRRLVIIPCTATPKLHLQRFVADSLFYNKSASKVGSYSTTSCRQQIT